MKKKRIEELKWNKWVNDMFRVYNRNHEIKEREDEKAEEIAIIIILTIWVVTWIVLVFFLIG